MTMDGRRFGGGLLWASALVLALVPVRPTCACSPKAVGYLATMRSDLRTVADWQERYRSEHGRYASQLTALTIQNRYGDTVLYEASEGAVVVLERGDERGWIARARHDSLPTGCAAGVGPGAPVARPTSSLYAGFDLVCEPLTGDPYRTRFTLILTGASLVVVVVATLWVRAAATRRRRLVQALAVMTALHPFWWAITPLNRDLVAPDCGIAASFFAVMFAAGAGLVCLSEWRRNRPRATAT